MENQNKPSIENIKKLIEMTRWVEDNLKNGCGQLTNLQRSEVEIKALEEYLKEK